MASEVSRNLDAIYARKRAAAFALCLQYAGLIIAKFRERQMTGPGGGSWVDRYKDKGQGSYWHNQTETAARTVFADAFSDGDEIGFFIAHLIEYGVYLELANDRRHEALRPLIEEFFPAFKRDLQALYADAA